MCYTELRSSADVNHSAKTRHVHRQLKDTSYISRESYTTRNVLWSRTSVCLSVCGLMPTVLHGPVCNLGEW